MSSSAEAAGATLPMTLIVLTYNEAANIARCLDSVPFVAEKLVVDSGSEDDTVSIARTHGARVVLQRWLGFGAQRNAASALAQHDWILVLDADECLTPALVRELEQGLPQLMGSQLAGAYVRRTAWFMGAPMHWYRPFAAEKINRIYHRARARWSEARVHEALRFDGTAMLFHQPLRHYLSETLAQQQLRALRYAELKALDWLERGRAARRWEWPFVFATTFFKDYVLRLAMFDGARGFAAAQLAASYAMYKRLRYYEMLRFPESVALAQASLERHGLRRRSALS